MKRYVLQTVLLTFVLLLLFGSSPLTATAQGISDLSVTIVANRKEFKQGQTITFTITATNLGPDAAPLIDVFINMPDQLVFISLTCDRGVSNDGDRCEYQSLEAGGTVVSTLVGTRVIETDAMRFKQVATTAIVSLETAATADPNESNNTATVITKLTGEHSLHH